MPFSSLVLQHWNWMQMEQGQMQQHQTVSPFQPDSLSCDPPNPGFYVVYQTAKSLKCQWVPFTLSSLIRSFSCSYPKLINISGFRGLHKEIFLTTWLTYFIFVKEAPAVTQANPTEMPFLWERQLPKYHFQLYLKAQQIPVTNVLRFFIQWLHPKVLCWHVLSFTTKDNIDRSSSTQSNTATHNLLKEDSVKD